MLSITGLPKDLEEYVDYSMITQAEGLKFGIEHFRRRKPHCSGTLFWQLNDCWPALSWSVLDYFGFGKAGYYYIKRAYAPVLASFKGLSDGDVELWVTNDTLKEVKNEVIVRLMTFAGDIVLEERPQVQVAPNCSRPVWRLKNNRIDGRPDRYLSVRSENNMFASNRHFFSAIKDLKRRPVRPEVETTANGDYELQVRLRAPEYAYFVHLIASEEVTHFADNYFDLEPDESRTVIVTNRETALTPEMVKIGWR
jgi:beta-mannosidase